MTIKELRQYRLICSELQQIECGLDSGNFSGSMVELLRRKKILTDEKTLCEETVRKIADRRVRRAIEIYCFELVGTDTSTPKWEDVADRIGAGNSGEAVRKAVERYLDKN